MPAQAAVMTQAEAATFEPASTSLFRLLPSWPWIVATLLVTFLFANWLAGKLERWRFRRIAAKSNELMELATGEQRIPVTIVTGVLHLTPSCPACFGCFYLPRSVQWCFACPNPYVVVRVAALLLFLAARAGFLGAGKTTLLNHILKGEHHNKRVAVIENEVGSISIDHSLLKYGTLPASHSLPKQPPTHSLTPPLLCLQRWQGGSPS